jgi:hypothetical protein
VAEFGNNCPDSTARLDDTNIPIALVSERRPKADVGVIIRVETQRLAVLYDGGVRINAFPNYCAETDACDSIAWTASGRLSTLRCRRPRSSLPALSRRCRQNPPIDMPLRTASRFVLCQ